MAVTKIRKVSSTTLLVLLALSVLIFVLFFAGGSELDAKGNKDYAFTGILLYWTYFLFIVTVLATLFFAGRSIATNKTKDAVALNEFDRLSKINGDILRHMIVKVDA